MKMNLFSFLKQSLEEGRDPQHMIRLGIHPQQLARRSGEWPDLIRSDFMGRKDLYSHTVFVCDKIADVQRILGDEQCVEWLKCLTIIGSPQENYCSTADEGTVVIKFISVYDPTAFTWGSMTYG